MRLWLAVVSLLGACGGGAVPPPCASCAEPDGATSQFIPDGGGDASLPGGDGTVWPNTASAANSDPWLVANHDAITQLRPKVLVLHFDNTKTVAQANTRVQELFASFAEGSRYHGYSDSTAQPFLRYELAKLVDLTDHPVPAGYTYKNSSRMPRKASPGQYVLDIQKLFDDTFVADYGYADPKDASRNLTMCELFQQGVVHELWVITEQNDPQDTIAPEALEQKQMYDASGAAIPSSYDSCGGNGCFATEDVPNCGVTVKFLSLLLSRGNGCQVHSQGHAIEGNFRRGGALPVVSADFQHFGNFDLDTRLGLPFDSWYQCAYTADATSPCMTYPTDDSVAWSVNGQTGNIAAYDQGCGNIHFAPNSQFEYDYDNKAATARSTCSGFGLHGGAAGADASQDLASSAWDVYDSVAPDCGGDWAVYWRQSLPGYGNVATRGDGTPMRNWWPYLFY